MSSLATLLKNSADKSSDDEKLMDLFQNRNELKQEFAKLRNEKYRLQDRLKQQDGAIARLQQKLEQIEELLVDPEWARNIMTYYQLRGMGQRCQRKLARFAEQLKQQREQKIMDQALAGWRQELEQEIGTLDTQIADRRDTLIQLEDQLKAANRRLEDMGGISRMFKSRSAVSYTHLTLPTKA